MSDISRQELEYIFNSAELGEKTYFLGVISSWINLRILDMLFENEQATAGEIARGINADMADVADSLREMQNMGLVTSEKNEKQNATYWYPVISEIKIKISDESGLKIEYSKSNTGRYGQSSAVPQNGSNAPKTNLLSKFEDFLGKYREKIYQYIRASNITEEDSSPDAKSVHTVQEGTKWTNKVEGQKRGQYSTQKEAARVGREIAKRNQSEHHLHGQNGQIREHRSYRNDTGQHQGKENVD